MPTSASCIDYRSSSYFRISLIRHLHRYVANLTPHYILALGETASEHQVPALRDAIWKYVALQTPTFSSFHSIEDIQFSNWSFTCPCSLYDVVLYRLMFSNQQIAPQLQENELVWNSSTLDRRYRKILVFTAYRRLKCHFRYVARTTDTGLANFSKTSSLKTRTSRILTLIMKAFMTILYHLAMDQIPTFPYKILGSTFSWCSNYA